MIQKTRTTAMAALLVAICGHPVWGQAPTILQIDTENFVEYQDDIADVSKFATNPNITPPVNFRNLAVATVLGDIVAVNGQPAKGLYASRARAIVTSPTPDRTLGGAIADTTHASMREKIFEILKSDGTSVGTIMAFGLSGGGVIPGSPAQVAGNWAIVGGTGAFLGARGQMGNGGTTVAARAASMAEDPANRRINGGGKIRWVLTIIPMSAPQIMATANGPAITHSSDFSLVTASKPAAAGEILSLFVSGLGPVRPGVDPGQPFPASPLAEVNSPVEVKVNGKSAEVTGAVGLPGAVDSYQVNFKVPPDVESGTTTVQVSAAWIAGPEVRVAVQ